MKKLCFGSIVKTIYMLRAGSKIKNPTIFKAIFEVYGVKGTYNLDDDRLGHIKDGTYLAPDEIVDAYKDVPIDYIAGKMHEKIIPLINPQDYKTLARILKDIISEDDELSIPNLKLGNLKGYDKQSIVNAQAIQLETLLACSFDYAIKYSKNNEWKKNIKEINKKYIDNVRKRKGKFELIEFDSKNSIDIEELNLTIHDETFDSVFNKYSTEKINKSGSGISFYALNLNNNEFEYTGLMKFLFKNISNYVYSRSKIKSIAENSSLTEVGANSVLKFIQKIKKNTDEVLGELLLYIFLEKVLKAPKILTKIRLMKIIKLRKK